MKTASVIAWEKWLASEEGQKCQSIPMRIQDREYLQNRLWRAFMEGFRAGEKSQEATNV